MLDIILKKNKPKNPTAPRLQFKSLNLSIYRPRFICVEIRGSNNNKKNLRKSKIYLFLIKKKYKVVFSQDENHIFKYRTSSQREVKTLKSKAA